MDKFGRVLVIIFFLCLFNLGLNFYILSEINKPVETTIQQPIVSTKPSPSTKPVVTKTDETVIQGELKVIKAEIRSLRDSLESTGLILQTPEP
jgi:hypothetical protein